MRSIQSSINVILIFGILFVIKANFFVTCTHNNNYMNNRPILGILAEEIRYHSVSLQYDSYIAASYVKYLESSGARVIPLRIGQNESYYEDMLSKINGVLFPGGSVLFNNKNGYAESGAKIFKIATRMNNNGDYFPVWGTCLGFELLIYLTTGGVDVTCNCSAKNIAMPLIFKPDFMQSKLFKNAPEDVIHILKNENVTANFHSKCITEQNYTKVNLTNDYRVISLNHDSNGLEFISTIEHHSYPFYGVQFHPEKNNFEWSKRLTGIPHTSNAIKISQYFSNFFVTEARKNFHIFKSKNEEAKLLIYNYPAMYTGLSKSIFEQCYKFGKE